MPKRISFWIFKSLSFCLFLYLSTFCQMFELQSPSMRPDPMPNEAYVTRWYSAVICAQCRLDVMNRLQSIMLAVPSTACLRVSTRLCLCTMTSVWSPLSSRAQMKSRRIQFSLLSKWFPLHPLFPIFKNKKRHNKRRRDGAYWQRHQSREEDTKKEEKEVRGKENRARKKRKKKLRNCLLTHTIVSM